MSKYILFSLLFVMSSIMSDAQKYYMLVGTYTTDSDSKGIYVYSFDPLKKPGLSLVSTESSFNPSYLAWSENGKKIYAVNENTSEADNGKGAISSFLFDKINGKLTFLNKEPSFGESPCYVATDKDGKNILVANYMSGNVVVYKTETNGALQAEKSQLIQYEGKGVHPNQEGPHAHGTFISPDGEYVFVTNLGNDLIYKYNFDPNGKIPLSTGNPATYKVPDGYGPRHIAFSNDGKYMYVICELLGKVITYSYDKGNLTQLQILDAAPQIDKDLDNGSAAVRVLPKGDFVYVSNRGITNNVAIFHIEKDGKLKHVSDQKVKNHPRDMQFTPDGQYLAVASRDDDKLEIYKVDHNTGLLTLTGNSLSIPKPVAISFIKK